MTPHIYQPMIQKRVYLMFTELLLIVILHSYGIIRIRVLTEQYQQSVNPTPPTRQANGQLKLVQPMVLE
jgi:hypothetical protein